jgi:hypothetical protein
MEMIGSCSASRDDPGHAAALEAYRQVAGDEARAGRDKPPDRATKLG